MPLEQMESEHSLLLAYIAHDNNKDQPHMEIREHCYQLCMKFTTLGINFFRRKEKKCLSNNARGSHEYTLYPKMRRLYGIFSYFVE